MSFIEFKTLMENCNAELVEASVSEKNNRKISFKLNEFTIVFDESVHRDSALGFNSDGKRIFAPLRGNTLFH